MATMLEYLQGVHPLPKDLIEDLRRSIKVKEVYKRYMWLNEGDVSNAISYIEKGLFRRFGVSDEGEEICTGFIKENEWFSSGSFVDQEPDMENIQAIEDSRVSYITHSDYNRLCNQYMIINKHFRIILEEMTGHVEQRADDYELKPYDRYLKLLYDTPSLLLRVPSRDLCSYLEIDEKMLQQLRYGKDNM